MRWAVLDGARSGDQRLPDDLPAEHALPAVLRRTAAKQIHFELLEIEHVEHGLDRGGHRQSRIEGGSQSDTLRRNKSQGEGLRAGLPALGCEGRLPRVVA